MTPTHQGAKIFEADPTFGVPSAKLLDSKRADGLTISPVTDVEFAPVLNGDLSAQNEFLLKRFKGVP